MGSENLTDGMIWDGETMVEAKDAWGQLENDVAMDILIGPLMVPWKKKVELFWAEKGIVVE